MKKFVIILLLLVCAPLQAQNIHTVIANGSSDNYSAITNTSDGGYAIVGPTNVQGKDSPYLAKLSATGALEWMRTITLSSFTTHERMAISQTRDGGYLLSGPQLIKTDKDGNFEWYHFEYTGKAIQTSDSGFLIGGNAIYNQASLFKAGRLVKLDKSGKLEWHLEFHDTTRSGHSAEVGSLIEVEDGYYIGGRLSAFLPEMNGSSLFVCSISRSGAVRWYRRYICDGATAPLFCQMIRTTDNGLLIASNNFPKSLFSTGSDQLFLKLDSAGRILWSTNIDGLSLETAEVVIESKDNEYTIAGGTVVDTLTGLFLSTVNRNGELRSAQQLTIPNYNIAPDNGTLSGDGTIILDGIVTKGATGAKDLFVLSVNEQTCFFKNVLVLVDHPTFITDSSFILDTLDIPKQSGTLYNIIQGGTQFDFCGLGAVSENDLLSPSVLSVSPNPIRANEFLTIHISTPLSAGDYELSFRNILGNEVIRQKKQLTGSEKELTIHIADLSEGIYTVELLDANTFTSIWHGKVVKVK